MGALYKLTFPNGRSYVGITSTSIERRMTLHRFHAREGRRCALHNAIRKYGDRSFTVETLAVANDWEYLCEIEGRAIEVYSTFAPNGYNLTLGGDGSPGSKWSDEARARIKGRVISPETRAKLSVANRGYRHTPEALEKIREASTGRIFSNERRAKIGATKIGNKYNLGKPCPPERAAKISAAQIGKKLTDEHRAKLSAAKKGRPWSAARRAAMKS